MKRFLLNVGLFSALLFAVLNVTGWLLIMARRQGHAVENSRIYLSIDKSRREWDKSTVYVFGDSVANQMYPPEKTNGRINSLALVMPSTMVGQYLLLKRLSAANNLHGKKIVLILSPEGFAVDLSHSASYHYVLKPFFNEEFRPWEDPVFSKRVPHTPISMVSQWPIVKSSNWNPPGWLPYLSHEALFSGHGISPLSLHYLRKMEALVLEAGASFRVLPTIQPESERGRDYSDLRAAIHRFHLDDIFNEYFGAFHYYPSSAFSDGAHLRNREILGPNVLGL